MATGYELLDNGNGRKLERFGAYLLVRPASQALWQPARSEDVWCLADAEFSRDNGAHWERRGRLPNEWMIEIEGVKMILSATDFGHLGVFPEHVTLWSDLRRFCCSAATELGRPPRVLNLFAYSGGATMAMALAGAEVCHLDAAKGMVDWARRNASANGVDNAPVRWIIDDALRFVQREARRGVCYDGVVLDPPSFGRGRQGQVFKIENHLLPLLAAIRNIMPEPRFVVLSCHTPELGPTALQNVLTGVFGRAGEFRSGEMIIDNRQQECSPLPCGSFALMSRYGV
jgi:23S rRNA (cytosine1962-C5)-methyltransferase